MAGQNNLQQREKPSQEVPVLHAATSTTATAPGAATSTTVTAPAAATSTTATAPGGATSTTATAPAAATSTTATVPDVPWVWPGCLWRHHAWPPGWAAPCAADPAAPPAAPACGTACHWSSLSCLTSPPAAAASRLQGCPKDLGKGQPGTNFNGLVVRKGAGSRPFASGPAGVMRTSTLYLGRALGIPSSLNTLELHWYACRF